VFALAFVQGQVERGERILVRVIQRSSNARNRRAARASSCESAGSARWVAAKRAAARTASALLPRGLP
jgi:hypothetical protein